ncbi:hypothetical protein Tco_0377528 [Tanacetum coccineum]
MSIPCSPECKIVRQILLDHPLSYALTATADVPVVVGYQGVVDKVSAFFTKNLAQPWQTMYKYAALLWWDFINNVFQKKEAIQYPCFIKLIDDVPLVSVYTTRNELVRGMLILDAFLTAEIRETNDFKEYETMFMKVAGTKKRKQTDGESSSRGIIIKRKKQSTSSIPPPGDDRERDEMAEATILSLTLHKTALDTEAK